MKLVSDKLKATRAANICRLIRNGVQTAYYRTLSDEKYLNQRFKKLWGRKISKDNPQTFNEKLQWLKLFWRDDRAEICADKFEVRNYVESKGLAHLLNNMIAIYNNVDDIDYNKLPQKFVLKCTHGSGCNIICDDKEKLDWIQAKKKLTKWMKINYYWPSREWVYKNIKHRIICEEFLEDPVNNELLDYKFLCFNGEPELIFFCSDRANLVKSDYYNLNWELMLFRGEYPPSGKIFPKPNKLIEMIEYSRKLAKGFPFVRVDFYLVGKIVYFGELTFFHHGGFGRYYPHSIDIELGKKIKLNSINPTNIN